MEELEQIFTLGLLITGSVVFGMFIASIIIKSARIIKRFYIKHKRNKK
jgi:hypothetical protein